ncbi:acyl-CoA dehydrogenase family protein [Chelatococcus sp.]|uniref:acyl-CoA dehydrogenase family protein n=1 Tax=Chelatococcus sp. TaxID=1953771 RepID=UPI0025C68DE2|nr:acyl-CoA dehydrogenase family protein [Chelatococcus sp.]
MAEDFNGVTAAELSLFRDSFRSFCEREVMPHRDQWREDGMVSRAVWRKAGDAGFLLASCPVELGGAGGDYRHEAIIIEELARIGFLDFNIHLHNAVVAPYLYHYATPDQIERWMPRLFTGELIGAIAMSEPSAGSDLKAIRTTARRDGASYVINGQKTFISNGQLSNFIIVACQTDPADGQKGISLIAVETDQAEGFRRGSKLNKIGLRAQDTSELFFDDVRVPAANLIGEAGKGFVHMMKQLPQERLTIAVQGVACMEAALEATLTYVKDRQAFGKRVFDFQNTRFVLANAKTETEIARVFVDHCVAKLLVGELDAVKAAMSKLWVTDRQTHLIDECLQLFGGYGYTLDYPISRMWTDARIQKIYGGTNEIMKEIIARSL